MSLARPRPALITALVVLGAIAIAALAEWRGVSAFAQARTGLRITQDRMAHASELLRKIKTSGLRVVEVPVTVKYTEHSKAKWQSGFQALRILFDYFFRHS